MSVREGATIVVGEKRKLEEPLDDAVSAAGKKNARVGASATDDEVDEFFAILRRIHVAVRYFKTSGEGSTAEGSGWRDAMLTWATDRTVEDASSVDGGEGKVVVVEGEVGMGLDLNLYPGSGQDDPV